MTVYPSPLAFLLALGPYVTNKGLLTLWLSTDGLRSDFFGLQLKSNPQEILALARDTLIQALGVALYTPKTVQRARVDIWLRTCEAAVSDPVTGDYYYDLLIAQASSRLEMEGGSSLNLTLGRNRSLGASWAGETAFYADLTVTP